MPDEAIDHVTIVVPARDEQRTIARALEAIQHAADHLPPVVRTDVIVVADACLDQTARVAHESGARVLEIAGANVGAARAAGVLSALENCGTSAGALWVAMTDADSVVPADWLDRQIGIANRPADLFLGTIALDSRDSARHPLWVTRYTQRLRGAEHGHVHGANLGFRASAYQASGGFRALESGEDIDLVQRMREIGARLAWSSEVPVTTSARHNSRAPNGVGADLAVSG